MPLLQALRKGKPPRGGRGVRPRPLRAELLEPRLTLTWGAVPPLFITPPTSAVGVTLDAQGDAAGSAAIASTEVDYYSFTATASGSYTISATTPGSSLDTVLGLYSASGQRLSYNDDIARRDRDSRITVNLTEGTTYLVGVTNYSYRTRGAYTWTIDGPAPTVIAPPATDPPASAPPASPVEAFPEVAYYGGSNEWNLNAINAPEAWAQGYTGEGVVVAVVDTGVDLDHPDLLSQLWVNAGEIAGNGVDDDHNGYVDDVAGWDFVGNDATPDDANGHGTHVAGTIAAAHNGYGATGVAPDATVMPVRVLDGSGSGTAVAVAAGIRYAARSGADIINLSLGGSFSSVIQSAIQYALQLDVLVVAAAGNEYGTSPSYPARFSSTLSNVISAGAHNASNAIANFSNDVGGSGAVQVDAPGVSVYSTYMGGRYATFSGTSMAAPHVAGLAALALSANEALTAAQLRSLIAQGADRTIRGSDSRGGIDAAVTVALAAAGETGSSTVATSSAASTWDVWTGTQRGWWPGTRMRAVDEAILALALESEREG